MTSTKMSEQSESHSRTTQDGNQYEFIQYVFVTLTYRRSTENGLSNTWMAVSRDWNRYIQRIRRLHGGSVGYLRTVEAHEDLYPHLHAILDFGTAKIRVKNVKFFDKTLYATWKSQWLCGHSDYQRPYSRGTSTSLLYIIKYITKKSTRKTICRKVFADVKQKAVQNTSDPTIQNKSTASPVYNTDALRSANMTPLSDPSTFFCHQFKIKQCTWSRNFTFPRLQPKSLLVAQSLLDRATN